MTTYGRHKVFAKIFIFWAVLQFRTLCCKAETENIKKIYAGIGKNVTLTAKFQNLSNENISIRWEPEYVDAIVDNHVEVNHENGTGSVTSTLKIINFHDEDFLLCYLNDEDDIFQKFQIIKIDEVKINHKLWLEQSRTISIFARVNETIKFVTDGFVENYSFAWFKYTPPSISFPLFLLDFKKYMNTTKGDTTSLTIKDLQLSDSGSYSTFYLENNPWNIFELQVLDDIHIEMVEFYYFPISAKRKEVICRVYGQLKETITFHICNTTSSNECSDYELISDNSKIEIDKGLYNKGVIKYKLLYPYKNAGTVKCSAANKTSVVSKVRIASFPSTFSIRALKRFDPNYTNNTEIEKVENDTIIGRIDKEIHLECAAFAEKFGDNIKWLEDSRIELGKNNDRGVYNIVRRTENYLNTKFYIAILTISPLFEEINIEYMCSAYSLTEHDYKPKVINVVFKRPTVPIAAWIIIKITLLVILLVLVAFEILRKVRAAKRKSIFPGSFGLNKMPDAAFPLFDFIKYLPYDKTFEFPEKRLTLGKCLGYGNFGMVHQGIAKKILPAEEKTLVAVKTVKDIKNCEALGCLISEMKIMIHLGKHLNVVNLLGAITKNVNKGELMVIVEYCRYGNLEMFLRKHRSKFINQIDPITDAIDPKITKDLLTDESNTERLSTVHDSTYIPSNTALISPSTSRASKPNDNDDNISSIAKNEPSNSNEMFEALTTTDLVCWAYQITRGMDFISKRNIMHGDLAARNILLADDNIVKICDFGLAKTMSDQYGNYIKKQGGQLPIKWLAIESLQDNEFSIKSDVWSFGILLWELFSLGCAPYPGISAKSFDFVLMLKNGYRMDKPEYANQELYDIMRRCWQDSPAARPKFSVLENDFMKFLEDDIYTQYIHMNEPYLQANEEYFKKQDDKKQAYLTILNAPNDSEPKYINDVAGYLRSVRNLEKKNTNMNPYVTTPLTEKFQFDFRDSEDGSPRYENNFNSLKRNKKKPI